MNILLMYPNGPSQPFIFTHSCERSLKKMHHVETFDISKTATCIAPPYIRRWGIQFYKGKRVDIRSVIKQCKKKPDVIIQIEGSGLQHLTGYKNLETLTAFWAIDSHIPIDLDFQRNIAKDFDYVFVAMKDYLNAFRKIHDNVFWLPLAADPGIHKNYHVNKLFDIGYVGSMPMVSKPSELHKDKMRLLNNLGKKYNVLAVGNVWKENVGKIYSMSKIGFNKSVGGDLNMRVFEIMSCGTLLLTDKIGNGLTDFFMDRKHLVLYETEDELDELIQYYLENEEEREKIAITGQKEVHEKHTYDIRMRTMLEVMGL